MALTEITITFDLHQLLGSDFDPRRTKAYVTTNVPNGTLMDTSTGETRLGDESVTIASDGSGLFSTWAVGADGNPTAWQTSLVVDYPRQGQRDRKRRVFGPWTLTTADDNKNITDLEEEQSVPPAYLTTVTTALDAKVDEAEAERVLAQQARTGAETARTGAETARTAAETAQAEAEAAAATATAPTEAQVDARIALQKASPNGIAPLDADQKLPEANVPDRLSEAGLTASVAAEVLTPGTPTNDGLTATIAAQVEGEDFTPAGAWDFTQAPTVGGQPIGGGGGGSGDVTGPASATADGIAVFSGTTGKIIKDGGKTLADLASAAQGALADTAVQPGDLATVATSGAYGDLNGKPTLGTAAAAATTDFATAAQGAKADTAVQPANLATVATTGDYGDLSGKPTLGDAAAKNTGTTTGTVAAGDDARMVDNAKSVGGGREKVAALSATSGTATGDLSTASIFTVTPTGNITLAFSNVPASGTACTVTVIVTQGATVRTVTGPTGTKWLGTAPSQAANKVCVLTLMTVDGGTTWLASGVVES